MKLSPLKDDPLRRCWTEDVKVTFAGDGGGRHHGDRRLAAGQQQQAGLTATLRPWRHRQRSGLVPEPLWRQRLDVLPVFVRSQRLRGREMPKSWTLKEKQPAGRLEGVGQTAEVVKAPPHSDFLEPKFRFLWLKTTLCDLKPNSSLNSTAPYWTAAELQLLLLSSKIVCSVCV